MHLQEDEQVRENNMGPYIHLLYLVVVVEVVLVELG